MQDKKNGLGWLVAAVMAGVMFGSGFQDTPLKVGVVDITKVVETSKFGKDGQAEFNARKAAREGVLQFIDDNRILTAEQATRLRDLSLKPNPTEAEKAELEKIKSEVIAADKKSKELAVKSNITPEDRTLLEEYSRRSQLMEQTAGRWLREFTQELQQWADSRKVESLERARTAINEVGKKDGYTIVMEVGVAPYGANDLTDAALKAMDAKN
jgi:Skp family chaperone for outer membrane proteins